MTGETTVRKFAVAAVAVAMLAVPAVSSAAPFLTMGKAYRVTHGTVEDIAYRMYENDVRYSAVDGAVGRCVRLSSTRVKCGTKITIWYENNSPNVYCGETFLVHWSWGEWTADQSGKSHCW
jgi:hypothetical protein